MLWINVNFFNFRNEKLLFNSKRKLDLVSSFTAVNANVFKRDLSWNCFRNKIIICKYFNMVALFVILTVISSFKLSSEVLIFLSLVFFSLYYFSLFLSLYLSLFLRFTMYLFLNVNFSFFNSTYRLYPWPVYTPGKVLL